jgi:hypothetical protein
MNLTLSSPKELAEKIDHKIRMDRPIVDMIEAAIRADREEIVKMVEVVDGTDVYGESGQFTEGWIKCSRKILAALKEK